MWRATTLIVIANLNHIDKVLAQDENQGESQPA